MTHSPSPAVRGLLLAAACLAAFSLASGCSRQPKKHQAAAVDHRPVQTAPMASTLDIAAADSELKRGEALFSYHCVSCHGAGKDHPGTDALAKKYGGRLPAVLDERTDIAPNMTRYYVRTGTSIMPFFRKTEISDSDLDALSAYVARNVGEPRK